MMTEQELNQALSRPSEALKQSLQSIGGDVLIVGAGGKMGPTLAVMARRALPPQRRVIAVSRFSDPEAKKLRHETVFPAECRAAFEKGAELARR